MVFCSALFSIAHFSLPSPILLAPMAGVTDTPWRLICQQWGAGLTTSEMLIANSQLWQSDKSRFRLAKPKANELPHSVQIVGGDAQILAQSAFEACQHGAQMIDINMSCPAKKVCKKAAGSALLQDERLVAEILHAVVNAVDVPVSLKIRTGWDDEHRNAVQIAKIAQDCGVQAIAIHGRSRAQRFNGDAEYDTIAEVKHQVSIPVIANGDIDSIEKALWVKRYTGADALMIGRGVQGRPWFIQELIAALSAKAYKEPSLAEKIAVMLQHAKALYAFYGEQKALGFVRKHMIAYLEHLGLSHYRALFNPINSAQAQLQFIASLSQPHLIIEGNVA